MYVDASTSCNTLAFQLGNNGVGTNVQTRSWSIKVWGEGSGGERGGCFSLVNNINHAVSPQATQYSCNYPNLAPDGCTQYYFGMNPGTVESYNYNNGNGNHLANQQQTICIRQLKTFMA